MVVTRRAESIVIFAVGAYMSYAYGKYFLAPTLDSTTLKSVHLAEPHGCSTESGEHRIICRRRVYELRLRQIFFSAYP
jgi:hypothetical protein